jgi:ATP-binding cassette subfamily B protein
MILTAGQLFIPALIRQVIDVGIGGENSRMLVIASVILSIIGIIMAVITYAQRYLSEWIAAHIGFDLRNQLNNHIQHLPFAYHDYAQTGQLISRCIEDVRAIERFTGSGVVDLVRLAILMVGIITLLFAENARLAAIALLPMIPLVFITTDFGRKIGKLFLVVDNLLGELSSRLQENVTGVQVVRAFAREPYEIKRFDTANRGLYKARLKVIGEWSKILPSSVFLVSLGTILILWFGGQLVLQGEMTIGEIVAFNSYLLLLTLPAQQLTWLVNLAGEAVAGVQRTYEILDLAPSIRTPENATKLSVLSGSVEFNNVSLNYSQEKTHALEDIQLKVLPNQIIALIGPTGSGKTSLVNLIPRFYDVSQGKVLVDGIDVRQVDLTSLRRQIGIVLQTSLLFSISVRENIAYGNPDASMEEIIQAAKAAQADEFITGLPDGYETTVGERGITLSGGQRQRVAIARALLMNPRILILDDSTSSVDTQTERQIQNALNFLMQGRTTFVIAHRLSTVRRADLILVMDKGRIVERGKHHELLEKDGLYRQIYELQLRDRESFLSDIEAADQSAARINLPKAPGIET